MEFQSSDIDNLFRETTKPQIIPISKLPEFRSAFSTKEWALLENIVLLPLIDSGEISGYFLLTEMEDLNNREKLRTLLKAINNTVPLILSARKRFSEQRQGQVHELNPNTVNNITKKAQSIKIKRHYITIDLERLISAILKVLNAHPAALKRDIVTLISSMLSERGNFYDLPGNKALLLMPYDNSQDMSLLLHQINISIGTFVPLKSKVPVISMTDKSFSDEQKNEEREFINGLVHGN